MTNLLKVLILRTETNKQRSLNRLQRNDQKSTGKKIKIGSLRNSPHKNKAPEYSMSSKLEKMMNRNVRFYFCLSIAITYSNIEYVDK